MKQNNYEGPTKAEAITKALNDLKINEEDLMIEILEERTGIIKKSVLIKAVDSNELIDYIKETIMEILKLMNINANLEVRKRDKSISIKMFSDNNNILIGRNGKTIQSLQTIIKQLVGNIIRSDWNILLDVENYKEKRIKRIEYLARRIARDVGNTKVETRMDSMNSYERRIVHEALSKDRYVTTESEGEEPNRYVVIKPKKVQ